MEPNVRRHEEFLTVFDQHRTIRTYAPARIPEEDINRIVHAGRRAPTDATGFMYTVIRVRDPAIRSKVQQATHGNPHIVEASDFFVICMDFHRQQRLLAHLGATPAKTGAWSMLFGITDAILVAENMAVAAEALGYGTGFIGGVQKDAGAIARILGCPRGVFPLVGLTIGVTMGEPEPRKRLPVTATFHVDSYHDLDERELAACVESMKSASGRFDWTLTLKRYFAADGEMETREPTIRASLEAQGLGL